MRSRSTMLSVTLGLMLGTIQTGGAQTTQEAGAATATVHSASAGNLQVESLATLEYPWGMDELPDGRLLITEKPGRLRIWNDRELSAPVQGVPEVYHRSPQDQGGLMDVAVDPDFSSNGYIYLSLTEVETPQPPDASEHGDPRFAGFLDTSDNVSRGGVVIRGRLEGERLLDVQVIWRQEPKTVGRGHFGNRILFDSSGKLFITSGERMQFDPAQNLESGLGKILRLNADGTVPDDNPFVTEKSVQQGVWSYGHRNVLAVALQPGTDRLWAMEMGPLGGDELNLIEEGANYGWPEVSNGSHYNGEMIPGHPGSDEFTAPVRTWTPVISPSGATFYSGNRVGGWDGSLLIGGLSSQSLVRLVLDGERVAIEERIPMERRIRDVLQSREGELFLLTDEAEGSLLRVRPEGGESQER